MRGLATVLLFLNLFFSRPVLAAETLNNSGLIQSSIWFSKDPFYAGEKVRIYSIIFAGGGVDLRGRVNFYDNDSLLCTNEFASLAGRVTEVWCDFTPGEGKHNISIRIANARGSSSDDFEERVALSSSELRSGERIVTRPPSSLATTAPSPQDGKISSGISDVVSKITEIFIGSQSNTDIRDGSMADDNNHSANPSTKNGVAGNKIKSDPLPLPKPKSDLSLEQDKESVNHQNPPNSSSRFSSKYIAGIYPALNSLKDAFYAFTAKIAEYILPTLKGFSDGDNKPLSYVGSFLYTTAKFILETPIAFATIILATIWQVAERIFKRRDDF